MRSTLIFAALMLLAYPLCADGVKLDVGEVAGTVTDESGQPLEGATVQSWTWVPELQTKTDKNGHFDLKGLEKRWPVELRVTHAGYSPWYEVNQPTGVGDLAIALNSKTFFEGVVTKPDGKPLAGARVRADSGPKQNKVVSIRHVWTETKADDLGRYKLFVAPDTYQIEVRDPAVGVVTLSATAGQNQGVAQDLQLKEGLRLVVTCLDAADQKPIPGVRVSVVAENLSATSNATGEAIFEHMMAQKVELYFQSRTHMRWWVPEALNARHRDLLTNLQWSQFGPTIDLTQGVKPVTLFMEKGVTCVGQVVDPQGQPVAGAIVTTSRAGYANSVDGTERFTAHTKKDGSFSFVVPACEDPINLIAHDGEQGQWRRWANGVGEPFDAASGTRRDGIMIRLTQPATLRGQVVDATGARAGDVAVRALGDDDRDNVWIAPTARTNQDGNFELRNVRPGAVLVQVEPFFTKSPGTQETSPISAERVTVDAGEIKEGVRVTRLPPPGPANKAGL